MFLALQLLEQTFTIIVIGLSFYSSSLCLRRNQGLLRASSYLFASHYIYMEPILGQINYQLQPVVMFAGDNWSPFAAAFLNYARQQGFYGMLREDGAEEPDGDAREPWRRKMAQATTAITSGWVSEKILSVFRSSTHDNAHTIWRRTETVYKHYQHQTPPTLGIGRAV